VLPHSIFIIIDFVLPDSIFMWQGLKVVEIDFLADEGF